MRSSPLVERPANLADEFRRRKPSTHRMDTMALHVRGPLRRPDLPGLFARVCTQLAMEEPRVVVCDVSGCEPDLVALAALTRLQLAARRRGCEIRLAGAGGEMLALVAFLGLREALPAADQVARGDEATGEAPLVEQLQVDA